ncbi:autophagy protein Apg6-domain-containing protein [Gamsiella multidivaricata]|uniref:autophagy protein Apg6-domain-containing protein n=1 Tax=Gamsiella multidivaricata TaxID=101098 RepID=UPI00221F4AA9|nr:autophagy protein Apg6-domain-containing protein [Gamsiella multidivaricata]KAI7818723.1 autophagy protein Apg6-domain-containing protein [Gamsiella multidivaricata]
MSSPSTRLFVCQKCNQQLGIDESLQDINSAAFDLLLGPLSDQNGNTSGAGSDRQSQQSGSSQGHRRPGSSSGDTSRPEPVFTRTIPPHNHSSNTRIGGQDPGGYNSNLLHPGIDAAESFIMLPKGHPSDATHQQLNSPNNQAFYSRGSIPPSGSYQGVKPLNSGNGTSSNVLSVNGNQIGAGGSSSRLKSSANGAGDVMDSMHTDRTTKANRLRTTGKLFDLMSAKSDIDHPLCHECAEMLLDSLAKQLRDVSRERDCYIDFLRTVNSNVASDAEMEALENEIKQIQLDESASIQALRNIEEQQTAVREEIVMLEKESLELDKEEERYWQECNEFQLALQGFHNERDSVNLKYDYDTRQLEKLHKTNVYNDTFCIGHDGHFATINGFRLGRLPTQPVDWPEINAAWGQTLLLLHTIANKLNFTFKTYRLVPLGSFSRIDKIEGDRASYELYGSGEFAIGRVFLNRRFDNAMVAFLNCLQQLGDYAEQQGPKLELPYKINKDRIGDASIKLQFSQGETWTRALKYTLTNTKWILAYASSSAASNMTSYTPSAPSLPISRRSSPAVKSSSSAHTNAP